MRLHPVALAALVCLPSLALADEANGAATNVPKRLEAVRVARPGKLSALFSTQVQLFIEQKEAPTASKTALRLDPGPRLSDKLKD